MGKVGAFNQYFESKHSDKIFKTISEELNADQRSAHFVNVQGTKYEIIEKYVKYIKDIKIQYEKECDSQFEKEYLISQSSIDANLRDPDKRLIQTVKEKEKQKKIYK